MSQPEASTDDATLWLVEAWRGLAAWMVVYSHYWSAAPGSPALLRFSFTGVDLFFVLSGFVFAPYLFGKPLATGAFGVRRFFRIYPAYFLALLIYFGMAWSDGRELAYWWQHLVFAYLQSREMAFYYNPVFWSLPSEVEFYLLLPVLAWLCRVRAGNFVALTLAALLLRAVIGYASDMQAQNSAYIWMYHLPGMLLEFLLGACAWWLSQRGLRGGVRAALLLGGLALWLALATAFAAFGDAGINASLARGQMSWLAALAFAAMVAAASGGNWQQAPAPLVQVALWAGRLSYGSYLFHIAALRLLQPHAAALGGVDVSLAAAALTLLAAWLAYKLWENPWRRFGRRLASY